MQLPTSNKLLLAGLDRENGVCMPSIAIKYSPYYNNGFLFLYKIVLFTNTRTFKL